jgi:hypothetical protein
MTTLLFVHGTGVRRTGYEKSLKRIQSGVQDLKLNDVTVAGCLWGDPLGTRLGDANSIPRYGKSGGKSSDAPEQMEVELWKNLYADPFYELRVLSLRPANREGVALGEVPIAERLDDIVRTFPVSSELADHLRKGEIFDVFEAARTAIVASAPYQEMLPAVSDPMGVFQDAIARALVAQAIRLASSDEEDTCDRPAVYEDARLRNEVVALVRDRLGPYQAFPGEWIVKKLLGAGAAAAFGGAATVGTPLTKWRRGKVMDGASPLCGDILLYQCRGEAICGLIERRINEVEPPVVLVAHSLGGVASVDLLIEKKLDDRVAALVTVGSQAPYFYEINALRRLERSASPTLPRHFPQWVNVYDLRDFLSFVGSHVFQGRVIDRRVNNRQPFPESHSAYFWNPEFYPILADAIKGVL